MFKLKYNYKIESTTEMRIGGAMYAFFLIEKISYFWNLFHIDKKYRLDYYYSSKFSEKRYYFTKNLSINSCFRSKDTGNFYACKLLEMAEYNKVSGKINLDDNLFTLLEASVEYKDL